MDSIAAEAHISKQSLYAAYSSKDHLYDAVVRDWVDQGHNAMRPHAQALASADAMLTALHEFARILQRGLLSRPVLLMRALVSAEAARFPQTAADYVTRSWDRNIGLLAESFATLTQRGLLKTPDPSLAAEQFTWLSVATFVNRATLLGRTAGFKERELDVIATEAVATFLSRFGPDAPAARQQQASDATSSEWTRAGA